MGPRIHTAELLDAQRHEPEELAHSLRQVAQVNRRLGGTRALERHLGPLLAVRPLRVLDVGTGNGETAAELAAWARGRGGLLEVTGLDAHGQVLDAARRRSGPHAPRLVQGDGLALPFRDGAFHVACCTLTLHHFRDQAAIRMVKEMGRVATRLVLVNDLERHRLSYASARVLSWTLWRRNRLTRNDGPLSVLRSFTPGELAEIGVRAGLAEPRVRRHFPFRLVLSGGPFARGRTER